MPDGNDPKQAIWMVLEDDHALRSLLTEMFKLWGRTAMTFPDGFRAAAWLDQIEAGEMKDPLPEVALMDIRVPGPLGPEIAARMRSIPAVAHIPIVIMTAYRLDPFEMQEISKVARPDGFIHKGDMLFDDIQTTLEKVVREAKEKASEKAAEPAEPASAASAAPVEAATVHADTTASLDATASDQAAAEPTPDAPIQPDAEKEPIVNEAEGQVSSTPAAPTSD